MDDAIGRSAIRNASKILIPFLLLLYFINYIDRINVGFAALTMNATLGLNATVFGIGASIFFVGYVALEIPSNLILVKVGARKWIARIMITWGIISACMALVVGVKSFYFMRFLLGVAEAGFFPGLIFYLTQWFPATHRARMVGLFMIGIPISGLVGAPLSTAILEHFDQIAGLHGWQWMFLIEGLPSIVLGIACFWILPDRPSDSKTLTAAERDWLQRTMDSEHAAQERIRSYTVWQSLTNPRVLMLAVILFLVSCGLYGSIFWIPQIVKTFGLSNTMVGWVSAIPYLIAVPAMILWTRHSDRSRERMWHVAIPLVLAATGFFIASLFLDTPIVAVIGLSMACAGIYASFPVFWTLPTSFLTGRAAAAGIALITATGNFSGIVAPSAIGWSKDQTGGFTAAMFGLGVILLIACLLVLVTRKSGSPEGAVRTMRA
jgi:ACS family tartrate transporter-like MFS transporter